MTTPNSNLQFVPSILSKGITLFFALVIYFMSVSVADAASLALSPSTGVYQAEGVFTARVVVNTGGKPVNAADGTLSFNPNELSVVSVNRSGSIFNLWVTEPTFSNSAGTISFSGGVPAGYAGQTGTVMNITFRAKGAGTARVNFTNGSVLANDGKGTNILTSMNGGTYTIQAASAAPEPEIIEYIAPANTPAAPKVTSNTHADPDLWHAHNEAVLSWQLPSDVTAVRTLLSTNPTAVPTKVYETPISSITLSELDEGVSYFHVQFKNADGWGRVTHFRLAIDTENPQSIDIALDKEANLANPEQVLHVAVADETSAVRRYKVKVDANEPFEVEDKTGSGTISLPPLDPGYHSVIIEAFDQAGNSIVGTFSFTIASFDRPRFVDVPQEINPEVIPVFRGETRPRATVTVFLHKVGSEPNQYTLESGENGRFNFIPEGALSVGVYELSAQAVDEFGAQSEFSDTVRFAVQQPGYLRVGSLLVSVLSVIVPLVILVFVLVLSFWYLVVYARRFRKRVRTESLEAMQILRREFGELQSTLRQQESAMQEARRTKKLTKAESEMIEVLDRALQASQAKVEKEIEDVTELTRKESKQR